MLTRFTIISLLALLLLFSCKQKKEQPQDPDLAIMMQVFPGLVDSVYVEIKSAITPPAIEEVRDSLTGKIIIRPVEDDEKRKAAIREDIRRMEFDSLSVTILLSDSIHAMSKDDVEYFLSAYRMTDTASNKYYQHSYPFVPEGWSVGKGFRIKLASQFQPPPEDSLMFMNIIREISFSRIIFNKENTRGMLTCSYSCGFQCGLGYRVFLVKTNNRWIVERIEESWVA